jgi:hypothetical protein
MGRKIHVLVHAWRALRGQAPDHGMTGFDDDAADEEMIRKLRYSTFRNSRSRLSVSVASGVSGRREASNC